MGCRQRDRATRAPVPQAAVPRVGRVGGRCAGGEAQTAGETRPGPACEPFAGLAGRCRRSGAGRLRVPSDTKHRKERPEGRRQGMCRGWFRLLRSASATRRLSDLVGCPKPSRERFRTGGSLPPFTTTEGRPHVPRVVPAAMRSARRSASATRRLSEFGWSAQSRHGNAFGTTTPHGGSSVLQNSAKHIGCAAAAALRLLRHDGDSRRRTTEARRG